MTDEHGGMTRAPLAFPGVRPVDGPGLVSRLRLTAVAAGYVLATVPALLLFVLTTVALALTPVLVGVAALWGLVPAVAGLSLAHRAAIAAVTGQDVPDRYTPTAGAGPLRRLQIWVRDDARWRDYALIGFSATGGFAMSIVVVSLAATPVTYVVLPLALGGGSWFLLLVIPPALIVWWLITPALVAARLTAELGILGRSRVAAAEHRAERASAARAETLDHSAAELRRIERDLHDGAQARLVSLGMNLGLAAELLEQEPGMAAQLLAEARAATLTALADLRGVVRGMHPPVLADRGLGGALEALALDISVPVTFSADLRGRPPAPVESALYFAVAECLANVVKHSSAELAWVVLTHRAGVLSAVVGDDGRGGADPEAGTGLRGIVRRLSSFEGTTVLSSPPGGPTVVRMEVPCALSSPRT